MKVQKQPHESAHIIQIISTGAHHLELDTKELEQALQEIIDHNEKPKVVIDMKEIPRAGVNYFQTLHSYLLSARGKGGDIKAAHASDNMRQMLERLSIRAFDSLDDAIDSYSR